MSESHFYASNAYGWVTTSNTRDLRQLIKHMDDQKVTWVLWFVPVPWNTTYDINFYAPQVEGATEAGVFNFKNGRKCK
jgi:hypothetical protein